VARRPGDPGALRARPGARDGDPDGRRSPLDAEQVVPGDIVELRAGERVPADARVLGSRGLEVDEAP
jgi:magnesium-transporting ATPase (P-type)